ncbi:glycosyltransferase, partial [bacterium]|nr:glycosyltransferase [bacterium]
MKILIHDYAGHAFIVELSRELARRGHSVLHLYAGYNITPRGNLSRIPDDPQTFSMKGLFIREPLEKYSFLKRWFQEREYGELLAREIEAYLPDVVISAQTPLDAQGMLYSSCKKKSIRFIFWVQDLIGIASSRILGKKLPGLGSLIGAYYTQLERRLLDKSDHIILITD